MTPSGASHQTFKNDRGISSIPAKSLLNGETTCQSHHLISRWQCNEVSWCQSYMVLWCEHHVSSRCLWSIRKWCFTKSWSNGNKKIVSTQYTCINTMLHHAYHWMSSKTVSHWQMDVSSCQRIYGHLKRGIDNGGVSLLNKKATITSWVPFLIVVYDIKNATNMGQ